MLNEHAPLGVAVKIYRDRLTIRYAGSENTNNEPPRPTLRASYGLTRKQVSRLTRGAEWMRVNYGRLFMYTFTFPNMEERLPNVVGIHEVISHEVAKRYLSTWLKRMKRRVPEFPYTWVAEIQVKRMRKRGERAIHFHLLSPVDIKKAWLCQSWGEVLGHKVHFDGVEMYWASADKRRGVPASYLTKYQAKERSEEVDKMEAEILGNRCGISHEVSAALKPIGGARFPRSEWAEVVAAFHARPEFPEQKYFASSDYFFLSHWGFDKFSLSSPHESTSTDGDGHRSRLEFGRPVLFGGRSD